MTRRPRPVAPRIRPTAATIGRDDRPSRRQGYWVLDEFGGLSRHTYPPFRPPQLEKFHSTSSNTPLPAWTPSTAAAAHGEAAAGEEDVELLRSTSADVLSSTSSPRQRTSTTLAAWWGRTPAWKTVRGYWSRDRWSGKMVWNTYSRSPPTAPSRSTTTSSEPPMQPSQPSTSSATVSTTSATGKERTSTDYGGEARGSWRRDRHGSWIWQPSFTATVTTKNPAPEVQSALWPASSTTPIPLSTTSSATAETFHTNVLHLPRFVYSSSVVSSPSEASESTKETPTTADHIRITNPTRVMVRGPETADASNVRNDATFTRITPSNILPGPSTTASITSESVAEKSPMNKNEVPVDAMSTTVRQRTASTLGSDGGFRLQFWFQYRASPMHLSNQIKSNLI